MTTNKIPFYATGLISVPAGFKRVSGPGTVPGFEMQREIGEDEWGDESGSDLHSKEFKVSESFVACSDTITLPADLGVIDSLVTIVGIRIETGMHKARLTVDGVYYTDSDLAPARKYTHGITLAKMFGAVDFLGGTAGDGAHIVSGTISITCKSEADFDDAGLYNGHEVTEGHIEATTEWRGIPTTPAGTGWDVVSAIPSAENKAFLKYSVTGHKKLASAAVGA